MTFKYKFLKGTFKLLPKSNATSPGKDSKAFQTGL